MINDKNNDFKTLFEKSEKTQGYCLEKARLKFTEDIISRMETEGISKSELARRINRSPSYVTKIMRGSTHLTLESMVKIASALGCKLNFSLNLKDEVPECACEANIDSSSLPTCSEADKDGCWWEGKKVRVRHEWYIDGPDRFVCRQCGMKAIMK